MGASFDPDDDDAPITAINITPMFPELSSWLLLITSHTGRTFIMT